VSGLRDRSVRAAECAAIKLNIVLLCVVPLIVPILRYTEHISNFGRSSVWKCIYFSNTLYVWRYI